VNKLLLTIRKATAHHLRLIGVAIGLGVLLSTGLSAVTGTAAVLPAPRASSPQSHGYWLVGSDGGVFSFGSAQFYGSPASHRLQRPIVGIAATIDNGGYWLTASDGGVFAYGDTGFYGSVPGLGIHPFGSGLPDSLNAPIVGMVASNDDGGYLVVASDGGVFAFGDARFEGSCFSVGGCSGAVVAIVSDTTGNGYWLMTQTGHVYAFGDAPYLGAPGPQDVPVTSATSAPVGAPGSYYMLFSNGSVYGNAGVCCAADYPSGASPATAIFTESNGGFFWVATADGSVVAMANAPYDGSMAGTNLNGLIVAGAGF